MKLEKNKIVFALVLLTILFTLGAYYAMTFGGGEENGKIEGQIPVPELEDEQKAYQTKLEAVDDIREDREKMAPSPYPEHMVDEKGYFNPDYMEYEKQRIIDSIYRNGQLRYESNKLHASEIDTKKFHDGDKGSLSTEVSAKEKAIEVKELGLVHQLFFASNPSNNRGFSNQGIDSCIYVRVDGKQTVKKDFRLRMRSMEDSRLGGRFLPRNTLIYGFVSFRPNRAMVNIESIDNRPISLIAYDYQDGSEGIYVQNTFRAQATNEVLGDVVDDVNIPGLPQVSGVKRIFRRNQGNIKVTIADNYQLILKPTR